MRFFELYRECGRLDGRPIALNAEEEAADALQREVLEAKAAAAHDAHGPLKPRPDPQLTKHGSEDPQGSSYLRPFPHVVGSSVCLPVACNCSPVCL